MNKLDNVRKASAKVLVIGLFISVMIISSSLYAPLALAQESSTYPPSPSTSTTAPPTTAATGITDDYNDFMALLLVLGFAGVGLLYLARAGAKKREDNYTGNGGEK